MTVLHLDSSARIDDSHSRALGKYLVNKLNQPTVHRDLAHNPLPPISAEDLIGVHGSRESDSPTLQAHLALSDQLIDELRNADTLVISMPMYNFSIPAVLKNWVDAICRAGVSFQYTQDGPIGLLGVKRAYIITASGGTPIGSDSDFASRYMEHICRFIGIESIAHIDASGSKGSPEKIIAAGQQQIDQLLGE